MNFFNANNSLLCRKNTANGITQTLIWDASGSAPFDDGDGSWNPTGGTNWVYGSTYGSWKDGSIARFGTNNINPSSPNSFNISVGTVSVNGIIVENYNSNFDLALSNGTINLVGNNPFITVNNRWINIFNTLAGSNGLIKNGSGGLLFINSSNTYSGATIINNGTIRVTGTGSIPSSSAIFIDNLAILDINRDATISNNISGSGTILRSSTTANTIFFTGNNSSFTGTYKMSPGIGYIAFTNDNCVGAPFAGFAPEGTAAGFYFTTSGNTLASTRTINLGNNCNFFFNGFQNNTNTIAALITGAGSITKQSYETHIFTNNNTYTGATYIRGVGSTAGAAEAITRISSGSLGGSSGQTGDFGNIVFQNNGTNGILEFMTANNLGICSQIRFSNTPGVVGYGGALRYIGSTNEIVNKTIFCNTGIGIRLESNSTGSGSITFNGSFNQTNRGLYLAGTGIGVLNNIFSGTGSLNKRGAGTWTIGGNNTYSGGTNITAGTLKAGTASAFGTGTITISSGATLDRNGFTISNTIVNNGGTIIN